MAHCKVSFLTNNVVSKKREALPLVMKKISLDIAKLKQGAEIDDILWDLGGRPKLRPISEAYERIRDGKPLGRAIWIPDMEESILGQCFTKKIYEKLSGNPNENAIMIKLDRGVQNIDLKHWVEMHESFFELDYSQYDLTIPTVLIRKAFNVIRCMFEWIK
jgi:hypothetical protein